MKESKKCSLCDTAYYRSEHHRNWHWDVMKYCSMECRMIVGHLRIVINSGHFKRAREIVENE